ncbi:MAG: hypothetical protein CL557_17790 [Alphaproteobacteria bacterium]|nr:hypothetical protein [Alphaproteobacteria bacterium]
MKIDRDELYNDYIQNYNELDNDEINDMIDLIEDILEIDDKRDLNFLKYQTIDELEDIKNNIINK